MKAPSYYNELRLAGNVTSETKDDSFVVRVRTGDNEFLRLLHLVSFMPVSLPGWTGFDESGRPIRVPYSFVALNWEAAGLLAMIHFNERDGSVIPDLPERLAHCDLRLTMELRDSQISTIEPSRQLYPLLYNQEHSLETPIPGGLIGSVISGVTKPLSVLSGVFGIPHVTPASSSSVFDEEHTNSPTLARTIPSSELYARAAVELLRFWDVSHAALIYSLTTHSVSFLKEMVNAASEHGIVLETSSYTHDNDVASVRAALEQVKDYRYIAAVFAGEAERIMIPAAEMGMASDEYVWILSQDGRITQPGFSLPSSQRTLAEALNGLAVVDINIPPSLPFAQQIAGLKSDLTFRSFFVESHNEQFLFDGYNWDATFPVLTPFAYTTYDAVVAMGLAACETPSKGGFFSGQDHYNQLKRTVFDGLSGQVSFDAVTGSRLYHGVRYGFTNVLVDDEASTNETIRFKSRLSMVLNPASTADDGTTPIYEIAPFVFRDGSKRVPPALPPAEIHLDHVSHATRVFGWGLTGAAMLMSLALGVWTFVHRKRTLLRLTQPLFLGMMCLGAFLMASSVLFLGWQEPWPHLDFACMAAPWLLSLGFCTAFSALFAKTWRINRLFRSVGTVNRVVVNAQNVLWPFLLITGINVAVLSAWTLLAPLRWVRLPNERAVDKFGRSTESTGTCSGDNSVFWIFLVLFNFLVVVFANYQTYLGRNIPCEFNETLYVAISMASLLECFLIGAPILVTVDGHPSAEFGLRAVLIAFGCGSILVPIYVHKFRVKGKQAQDISASQSTGQTKPHHQPKSSESMSDSLPSTIEALARAAPVQNPRKRNHRFPLKSPFELNNFRPRPLDAPATVRELAVPTHQPRQADDDPSSARLQGCNDKIALQTEGQQQTKKGAIPTEDQDPELASHNPIILPTMFRDRIADWKSDESHSLKPECTQRNEGG